MIQTIGIIGGTGKMGQMFANNFRKIGKQVLTSDEYSAAIEKEIVNTCDLVILSVPIDTAPELCVRIRGRLHENQIFSDFTSV